MPKSSPPLDEADKEKLRKNTRNWMKYSGMAIQMIGIMLFFVLGGIYLDGQFGTSPLLTVIMSLLGVGGGLYSSLKDFL